MKRNVLRLPSIDVFRAVTMLLMIFVNDIDGVPGVPLWIKHVGRSQDGLGFADVIFPAFLFIAGLSIPFSLDKELERRNSTFRVLRHILSRSAALIIMGLMHVNLEHYSSKSILPHAIWEILVTVSFFLIWLAYPPNVPVFRKRVLQISGWIILLVCCFLFRGETGGKATGFHIYWWGILGLIGWSYLIGALLYLFCKSNILVVLLGFLLVYLFNIAVHTGFIDEDASPLKGYIWLAGNGAMPSFALAGVFIGMLYKKEQKGRKWFPFFLEIFLFGIFIMATGFLLRPVGGISKIRDTPSWVGICSGISILAFGFFIWIVDILGQQKRFGFLMPAGRSTLTCYLLPYILYSIFELLHFHYPVLFSEGWGGMVRSVFIAFFVVALAGMLEKIPIRIKL